MIKYILVLTAIFASSCNATSDENVIGMVKNCLPNESVAAAVASEILKGKIPSINLSKWKVSSMKLGKEFKVTFEYDCPTGRKCIGGLTSMVLSAQDCSLKSYSAQK